MDGAWRHKVGHTAYTLEDTRGTRRITQKNGGTHGGTHGGRTEGHMAACPDGHWGVNTWTARGETQPDGNWGGHMDGAWGHTVGHTAGHIGGHQKNAQKHTDGTHGRTHGRTNGGTHRRTHCGMPGWKFGGHMESACRHTVGARSLTHGRTPEERAEAHRWHARRDTQRDARKDAWRNTWKDARRHAPDGNWGRTHGRRIETHGEAHGLTQNGRHQKNTQDYTGASRSTWGGGAHGGRTEGWGTRQHAWRHARKHRHTHMAGTQARMHDSTKARCMPNFKF